MCVCVYVCMYVCVYVSVCICMLGIYLYVVNEIYIIQQKMKYT